MLTKDEVAINLRKFAKDNFKSLAELGRKLEMRPQNLQIYFEGRSYPGGLVLGRLSELGCDINWLLTGDVRKDKYIPSEELKRVGLNKGRMYKIVARVPTKGEKIEHYLVGEDSLYYDVRKHLFINIDEKMTLPLKPLVNNGNMVMIDLDAEIKEDDIVLVRYGSGKEELRIYAVDNTNQGMVMLLSNNPTIKPKFVKQKNITMHQVILIKK